MELETEQKIHEAFGLLHADSFRALSLAYTKADQKLMKSRKWDDENPALITNQVKAILEQFDPTELNEEDQTWWYEIMWFWYHHAISFAIYQRRDKALAQRYADKAVQLQTVDHPNRITKLLRLLVHDRVQEAREMAADLMAEATTAIATLREYEQGDFFRGRKRKGDRLTRVNVRLTKKDWGKILPLPWNEFQAQIIKLFRSNGNKPLSPIEINKEGGFGSRFRPSIQRAINHVLGDGELKYRLLPSEDQQFNGKMWSENSLQFWTME